MRRNNVIPKKLLWGTRIPYNSGGGVCQFHFKGTVKRAAKCTTHPAKRVKKRCCAFYHPRIKPVLQQFRLLQVAKSCCRVGSSSTFYSKTCVCGALYRDVNPSCMAWLPRNSIQSQDSIHAASNNLMCCETGLNVCGKTRNVTFHIVLQQCSKEKSLTLVPSILDIRQFD